MRKKNGNKCKNCGHEKYHHYYRTRHCRKGQFHSTSKKCDCKKFEEENESGTKTGTEEKSHGRGFGKKPMDSLAE